MLEPQKSCESWVETQQIRVNCYRAFHAADQVQDHNALLKSMHILGLRLHPFSETLRLMSPNDACGFTKEIA